MPERTCVSISCELAQFMIISALCYAIVFANKFAVRADILYIRSVPYFRP